MPVGVTGARCVLKASIGHDAGGFNALARQTGRRGRRCHRGNGKSSPSGAQGVGKYLAPRTSSSPSAPGSCSIHAREASATIRSVLITGDRISDVGAAVELPTGTRVIDLSSAAVLPGMIDTHVHVNSGGTTLGLWKPSCRRDRNGASQVCHEKGRDYSKRSRFWCGGAHTLGLPFAFANNPSLIVVCSRA
jgi:hypothetical protein